MKEINIPKFKEAIKAKLEADGHDTVWLAKQMNMDEHVLAMLLARKSMKNVSSTLRQMSEFMGVEIPRFDDDIEDVPEIKAPTMTDDDPMLEMNKRELWVDGKKYTVETIRKMVEDATKEHREFVHLTEMVEQLQMKADEKDKDAIKWKVQADEYREQIAEMKEQSDNVKAFEDMTISDAIKLYRTFGRLFKDEVLQ